MPFSFIFEGSFLDMQRFLARVDRFVDVRGQTVLVNGRLLTVDGISLSTAEGTATSKVKATIAATAYLAPGDSATGQTSSGTGTAPSGTAPSGATSGSNSTAAISPAPAS
jgi:hypothetical protein